MPTREAFKEALFYFDPVREEWVFRFADARLVLGEEPYFDEMFDALLALVPNLQNGDRDVSE
jgi:hypothetical protein